MNPNAINNDFCGEQAAGEQIMQMNDQAAAQQIMQTNNQAAAHQLMQMSNQPTPWPQLQMNDPPMPWQTMPMNKQDALQQPMPMNNQAAVQQPMPMNNQAAVQQPMQINNQAAAQLLMQMNNQAAAKQLMQMNNQPTPRQRMEMKEGISEKEERAEGKIYLVQQINNQQLMEMMEEISEKEERAEGKIYLVQQMNNQQPMEMNEKISEKKKTAEVEENIENKIRERNADVPRYRRLHKAIRERNWKAVEDFVNNDPEALNDDITEFGQNILHLLLKFDETIGLVEKFVKKVTPESLERGMIFEGSTALAVAAVTGKTEAAKVLVNRNNNLLGLEVAGGLLPVHLAAIYSQKETVEYLLSETAKVVDLTDENGATLLEFLITSNLFGTALYLLKQYPELARDDNSHWSSIFDRMASDPLLFASGTRLGFWQSFVYHRIPLQEEKKPYPLPKRVAEGIEKPIDISESSSAAKPFRFQQIRATFGELLHGLNIIFWNAFMLVPSIKGIHEKKLNHTQTLEIVKMMIGDYSNWNFAKARKLLKKPVFNAASLGIYEVVREILKAYKPTLLFLDDSGHTVLSRAVLHRHEKVFNLAYELSDHPWADLRVKDVGKNSTILHQAGELVPSSEVPGAALQMQRELQWFKMVEDYFHPSLQGKRDGANKTPKELFTETHGVLVDKGEKWMKETATSCSVVAALIITVVFAAAFTVPGGLDDNGRPIFFHDLSFKIFSTSIALALFSSTASVQMFLGILTSRYAENDFLFSLPKKLMIGLIALFFSIASMMVAFASTFSIVISHPSRRVTFLVASLGAVPVTLFAWMQFPLLVDIYKYTYGNGIRKPAEIKDAHM